MPKRGLTRVEPFDGSPSLAGGLVLPPNQRFAQKEHRA
jgi:hypothetical protein